jgi:hypothetical protein
MDFEPLLQKLYDFYEQYECSKKIENDAWRILNQTSINSPEHHLAYKNLYHCIRNTNAIVDQALILHQQIGQYFKYSYRYYAE